MSIKAPKRPHDARECACMMHRNNSDGTRDYALKGKVECRLCRGTGRVQKCRACGGAGLMAGGSIGEGAKICDACDGHGQVPSGEKKAEDAA